MRFVREIVLPERGEGKIEFKMFEDSDVTQVVSPPSLNELPICDVSMKVLFDTLSLDDIMTLWWALVCEEKTIILSERTSVMSDVCTSLVSLLYPLKWCFARLDVVPCTWCSSAKHENFKFLLLFHVSIMPLKLQEYRSYRSLTLQENHPKINPRTHTRL